MDLTKCSKETLQISLTLVAKAFSQYIAKNKNKYTTPTRGLFSKLHIMVAALEGTC